MLSVLLHAINAVFVWLVLRRLDILGAWFDAAVFAIHPVNVASARYNLAIILANQGKTDEAISQLGRAVEVEPGRQEFRTQLEAVRGLKSTR